ncbi:HAD-IB family hydrolase [Actinoplanes sp. NEAU-A12]|uniref:HAD-IB family hydrolase n=1 Tax=Actinoplanes sandaracinus TaxID=3045177 RepID=A0ABT6WKX7_9ACTN|nr:HAD-IB family hydrolase [Actinoplanes sandaracinus]MDI6100397.1 HAD-IB family hydrolase [Actinoplanes sandaracinus]
MRRAGTRPVAFFDVDETLIAVKSMFDFLDYHRRHGGAARPVPPLPAGWRGSRTELNRAYYRGYAGVSWARLLEEGRRWYADLCRRPRPFIAGGLDALHRHRAAGHAVVLVSGSFLPCLGPLARHLGADSLVCARPEVTALGTLTGEIRRPVIGPAKAAAADRILAERQVHPDDCFAYADHASDLDLLDAVGHPHVVGDDPVLRRHARERGWPVLPAHLVPAPPATCGPHLDLEEMTS